MAGTPFGLKRCRAGNNGWSAGIPVRHGRGMCTFLHCICRLDGLGYSSVSEHRAGKICYTYTGNKTLPGWFVDESTRYRR